MWQAEVRVDLDAIRDNVARLRGRHQRRADGGGQGRRLRPRHAAGRPGGARRRRGLARRLHPGRGARPCAGPASPRRCWPGCSRPGCRCTTGVAADVDLSAASLDQLAELVAAGRQADRPARVHLKLDTGLSRGGATAGRLAGPGRGRRQGAGRRRWSRWSACGATSCTPTRPATRPSTGSWRPSARAWTWPSGPGCDPGYRHLANSAATLTRPDTHFDLVRPGIAVYGLSPVPGETFGLRPAMTARARVMLTKRVPAGHRGVVRAHLPHRAGDHPRPGAARLRRRGAPARLQRRPGAARRPEPDHRRPGLHGPVRGRLRRRPGGGRRRGDPVRQRRGRRAHRRRLGRGDRHDQLRDRHPDRRRTGAPGLRRGVPSDRGTTSGPGSGARASRSPGCSAPCVGVGGGRGGRRGRRRAGGGPPVQEPDRPVRRRGLRLAAARRRVHAGDAGRHRHPRRGGRARRRRCGPADRGLRARLLPGHGHLPLPAQGAHRAGRGPPGLLRPAGARPVRPVEVGRVPPLAGSAGRCARCSTGAYRRGRWCWSVTRWAA